MSQSSTGGPLDTLGSPLGPLESNVLIAGLEAVVAVLVSRAVLFGTAVVPIQPAKDWQWSYALVGLLAIVGLFLLGLMVEGIAGLTERWVIRDRHGNLRKWYDDATHPPSNWGPGQRWMWKSPEAAAEFARRRVRILVARNSAVLVLYLTLSLLVGLPFTRPSMWGAWWVGSLLVGAALVGLLGYVWVSANEGWNRAVRDAGEIGDVNSGRRQ